MKRLEFKIGIELLKKLKDNYINSGFASVSAFVRYILHKYFEDKNNQNKLI